MAVPNATQLKETPGLRKMRQLLSHVRVSASDTMFLDIETTGLSRHYHRITLVGFMVNGNYDVFVTGDDPTSFRSAAARARAIVTFNGSQFDLPFLTKEYPDISLPEMHVDLRYACRYAGLTGGQKKIEKALGIERGNDLDGAQAVLLWHRYVSGDEGALPELIKYNYQDVTGMATLLDHVDGLVSDGRDLFEPVQFAARSVLLSPELLARHPTAAARGWSPQRYSELFDNTKAGESVIVGLDLTGSEARPSGAAVTRGNKVETATLSTDTELLDFVEIADPDLVSIDSPLCLPIGRASVFDNDPGREEFGILRKSERILKQRGINVYPCLLPSMQRLTKRGIELADQLRKNGIPVIESYPGAAQDIVGIARKGAGTAYLAEGLRAFGYDGQIDDEVVTHDELDAITCCMVGSFFLSSRFEALAGDGEDPLIIPKLEAARLPLVVGVSGRISAGKTTFARALETAGFSYLRYSQIVDEVISQRGLEPNRLNRQRVGQEINEGLGQRWLGRRLLERMKEGQAWVVDGLRFKEDHAFWFERLGYNFRHIHVDALADARCGRYLDGSISEMDFHAIDHAPVEREIPDLATLAHENVRNDKTLGEFKKQAAERAADLLAEFQVS